MSADSLGIQTEESKLLFGDNALNRIVVRPAFPLEAKQHLDFVQMMAPSLNFTPEEFYVQSVQQEKEEIAKFALSKNSLFLVAKDRDILGTLTLTGRGMETGSYRKSNRHIAQLGISVLPEARGYGIGQRLFDHALKMIKACPLEIQRIEVENYVTNHRARDFFLHNDFEIEGVKRKAIKLEGEFIDVLMLALLLPQN